MKGVRYAFETIATKSIHFYFSGWAGPGLALVSDSCDKQQKEEKKLSQENSIFIEVVYV